MNDHAQGFTALHKVRGENRKSKSFLPCGSSQTGCSCQLETQGSSTGMCLAGLTVAWSEQAFPWHWFPWLRHVFAKGGYVGDKLKATLGGRDDWTPEIIKRSDTAKRFEVWPRRWGVEQTFTQLGLCRRLAKD
jgi:hypothetical protein